MVIARVWRSYFRKGNFVTSKRQLPGRSMTVWWTSVSVHIRAQGCPRCSDGVGLHCSAGRWCSACTRFACCRNVLIMRIAQVAPLCESVPPKLYGGTERVVSYLTEELVNLGHHVTLFASGDSLTSATLAASWPHALRLHGGAKDDLAPHILMLEQVAARASEFDVIHFHIAQIHFPVMRRLPFVTHVTTLHGRL